MSKVFHRLTMIGIIFALSCGTALSELSLRSDGSGISYGSYGGNYQASSYSGKVYQSTSTLYLNPKTANQPTGSKPRPRGYVRPQQPKPAQGVNRPSDLPYPYSATANKTFDGFTGMSLEQLSWLNKDWAAWRVMAAAAAHNIAGCPLQIGSIIFAKLMENYDESWHPQTTTVQNSGRPQVDLSLAWKEGDFDLVLSQIGTENAQGMQHLFNLNTPEYIWMEDDLAFFHHSRNVLKIPFRRVMNWPFFYYTEEMIAAMKYLVGSKWTAQQQEGYNTLWRYMNWFKANEWDKYDTGCKSRSKASFGAARACENCGRPPNNDICDPEYGDVTLNY